MTALLQVVDQDATCEEDILVVEGVTRVHRVGGSLVFALDGLDLRVRRGEFLAVEGRSGSGKSTLLNVIGCLDRPTNGRVIVDGVDVTSVTEKELPRVRREKIGFVFQQFNLIPVLTALENVMLPLEYAGRGERQQRERALAALEAVGMADRVDHRPTQLSGGQQQRVAIARALALEPPIVLADEPTGALDSRTAGAIMALLHKVNREHGATVIVVTHDHAVSQEADRIVHLSDGRVASETAANGHQAAGVGR